MSNKKNLFLVSAVLIILFGFFLRAYNFSDWLHFELDQSRDAKVVDLAIKEGIDNLPLLGPKAAGTFLRLGPAFYYFEYLSAKIFGNTPGGIAVHDLIFSCLAIVVFYFFIREYFSKKISLGLLGVFSTSLFLVVYSRFAWNPNTLPFFTLLTFYALLQAVKKDGKKTGWWLMLSAFSLAISTQMHFLAFLSVPAITGAFLILKRPRIKLRFWLASLAIIFLLNFPVLINEMKTGGDNAKEFLKAVTKKSDTKEDYNIVEKLAKNYTESSLGHFLIVSGVETGELPRFKRLGFGIDILCDKGCRDGLPIGATAFMFFTLGILALLTKIFFAIKKKTIFKEENNFVLLISLWFLVTFGLFTLIAFDISPRFFLLVSGLPFVFLGLILEFLEKKSKKYFLYIFLAILAVLISLNLLAIQKRFSQMKRASFETIEIAPDRVLKERSRVTLEQQYLIVEYMEKFYTENNFPIYFNSEPFYHRSFSYHLTKKNIPNDDAKKIIGGKNLYSDGNYFLIYSTRANWETRSARYLEKFNPLEKTSFGTLSVLRMEPKKELINAKRQAFQPEEKAKASESNVAARYRWEEIFEESTDEEE